MLETRMSQDTVSRPSPVIPPEEGQKPATPGPIYKSVADGELKSAWTLSEYFASLNTVMRLPAKVRRKARDVAKGTPGGEQALAVFDRLRIPTGWLTAAALLAVVLLVGRPLLAAGVGRSADLTPAYGVWQAGKGRYEGRTFQIVETHIAFGTSSKAAEYTWHKVRDVKAKAVADSTLFTVVYDEDGKAAEFAFWYVGGRPAAVHVVHQPEVVWTKSTRSPSTPPNS
jgi:uncharacterized membrane protein